MIPGYVAGAIGLSCLAIGVVFGVWLGATIIAITGGRES